MKVRYLGIVRPPPTREEKPLELCKAVNTDGYSRFTKGSVSEFCSFISGEVAKRTPVGTRQRVEEQGSFIHAYHNERGVCGILVSDDEYPKLSAQYILSKITDEFLAKYPSHTIEASDTPLSCPFPELNKYINDFQDPNNASSIHKIQRELDETKIVLHKTIESVLERGEKIDNLVAKSDGLSAQSKMFYTQAKKQNSCCTVM